MNSEQTFQRDNASNLYLKPSETFKIYMESYHYVKQIASTKQYPPNLLKFCAIWQQNSLRTMLDSFLFSTSITLPSLLIYPFFTQTIQYRSKRFFSKVHTLEILCSFLAELNIELPNGYKSRLQTALMQQTYSSRELAELIAQGYQIFDLLLEKLNNQNYDQQSITAKQQFEDRLYHKSHPEYLYPLIKLQQAVKSNFQEFVSGFYIHESMATMDYSLGYSDVDTLIIIREDIVKNPDMLIQLRNRSFSALKYLYAIDPYQHHGFMLLTELDMKFYPQPYFPLTLFNSATDFLNQTPASLTFKVRNSKIERQMYFWQMYYQFRAAYLQGQKFRWWYLQKNFIQGLVLLPVFYLQLNEEYANKKDVLHGRLQEDFQESWEIINKITQIRNQWPQRKDQAVPKTCYRKLLNVNPELVRLLYNALHYRTPGWITNILGPAFVEESFLLADQLLESAKTRGWLSAG